MDINQLNHFSEIKMSVGYKIKSTSNTKEAVNNARSHHNSMEAYMKF